MIGIIIEDKILVIDKTIYYYIDINSSNKNRLTKIYSFNLDENPFILNKPYIYKIDSNCRDMYTNAIVNAFNKSNN